jgi:hypothetical protein
MKKILDGFYLCAFRKLGGVKHHRPAPRVATVTRAGEE